MEYMVYIYTEFTLVTIGMDSYENYLFYKSVKLQCICSLFLSGFKSYILWLGTQLINLQCLKSSQ